VVVEAEEDSAAVVVAELVAAAVEFRVLLAAVFHVHRAEFHVHLVEFHVHLVEFHDLLAAGFRVHLVVSHDLLAAGFRVHLVVSHVHLAVFPGDPGHRSAVRHHSIAPAEVSPDHRGHRHDPVRVLAAVRDRGYSQDLDQALEAVPVSAPAHRLCPQIALELGQGSDQGHRPCQGAVLASEAVRVSLLGHRLFRPIVQALEQASGLEQASESAQASVPELPIGQETRCRASAVAMQGRGSLIRGPGFRTAWPIVPRPWKVDAKT